jgi:tRNA pseudouridine55 synthase
VIDEKNGEYSINVECSKGTYIRTLCADIGKALGCGGVMSALNRTKSGNFDILSAHTIDKLENMSYTDRVNLLIPTEKLFSELDNVTLSDFYARLFKSGCEIYQSKIKTAYPVDSFVRVSDKNGFFALGKVSEFENGTAIKSVKMFVI